MKRCLLAAAVAAALTGCGSAPRQEPRIERPEPVARAPEARPRQPAQSPTSTPAPTPRATRGGGYYLDDGPGDSPPPDLDNIPEPVPQPEPLHRPAMRPYVVLGQTFTPMTELTTYKARGVASWYGRRYHGKQTSNGEIYDMYGISAAHPTLPIPSYARVTHVASGRSIVVRVNDRGPFLSGRLIDLSYTAAYRLGVLGGGSGLVDVETIIPDGLPPGSTYAAAPPGRARVATAQTTAAPRSTSPAPAPNPYDGQADPILAIAAAASAETPAPPASVAPAPPPRVASAALPLVPEAPGVYLQLGAFGSRENAEGYLERARVQFEWLAERLQVRAREGLFRVHAGPYSNPNDARQAAERIALASGVKPVITR